MNNSYDLKHRVLIYKGRLIHLYFLASLSNDTLISRLVEGRTIDEVIEMLKGIECGLCLL